MAGAWDSVLFEPLRIGKLEVGGRVFKGATTETLYSSDGFITDELLSFYEPLAYAGTPLIVTGALYVNRQGKMFDRAGGIDADDKIPGLRSLADTVHRHDSTVFAQLGHCGRQVFPKEVGLESAVSASPVRERGMGTKPRAMTLEEVRETIADFGAAAGRAQAAGFDGVQLLAGVGYLISAFLTPHTNRRKDQYGGSLANRMRFVVEILRAVREQVGDEFPVIAKLNGTDALRGRAGMKTEELLEVASALEAEGLDGVEITAGHYESGGVAGNGKWDGVHATAVKDGRLARGLPRWRKRAILLATPVLDRVYNRMWPAREGFLLSYASQFKARLDIPVISGGGFRTRPAMEQAISSGQCDAVAAARAMVADPFLYKHLREGVEGPACDFCQGCAVRVGSAPVGCYHPRVGAERAAMLAAEGLTEKREPGVSR